MNIGPIMASDLSLEWRGEACDRSAFGGRGVAGGAEDSRASGPQRLPVARLAVLDQPDGCWCRSARCSTERARAAEGRVPALHAAFLTVPALVPPLWLAPELGEGLPSERPTSQKASWLKVGI
jgi:hypothetical protein